jgi:hypothetical protein
VCVGCGRLFPEQEEPGRALVVRRAPEDPAARQELARLLAAASGRDEAVLARYLDAGEALFCVPASELVVDRLNEALGDAGADTELAETVSTEREWSSWWRALWRERAQLPLLALLSGCFVALVKPGVLWFWFASVFALAAADVVTFRRRITLTPALLARRLGMMSASVARPAAALFRRARSVALRETLGVLLVEQARLLGAVARALGDHPALQAPFREALDEVGQRGLEIAESAVAIEEAGDTESADVLARLTDLRALGSVEIERQLRELVTSRDQRQARREWLRQTHAILLLRLEALSERLRGLRQESAQRLLELRGAEAAATDQAFASLGRELELAAAALGEVERSLPQSLPEVIAEVVGDRR